MSFRQSRSPFFGRNQVATGATTLAPIAAVLVIAGLTPTLAARVPVTAATLTLSAATPTVKAGVNPSTASLSLSASTPALRRTVRPAAGSLTLGPATPSGPSEQQVHPSNSGAHAVCCEPETGGGLQTYGLYPNARHGDSGIKDHFPVYPECGIAFIGDRDPSYCPDLPVWASPSFAHLQRGDAVGVAGIPGIAFRERAELESGNAPRSPNHAGIPILRRSQPQRFGTGRYSGNKISACGGHSLPHARNTGNQKRCFARVHKPGAFSRGCRS
jgi:hypothetical protein